MTAWNTVCEKVVIVIDGAVSNLATDLCCVGNLYISDLEAADADTYICEAHFADDSVLTTTSRLSVISKLVWYITF